MSDNAIHAIAGAGGGLVSMGLTYPLFTISTRLQVQRTGERKDAYKGNLDVLKKILNEEGVAGLFSGIESALFGSAITNGVYYYFFEATKKKVLELSGNKLMGALESLLTGAISGAMTVLITNPIWVVNTRMAVAKNGKKGEEGQRKSMVAMFREIVTEDKRGVLALWQGVIPALVLVLNPMIQYAAFEQFKNKLSAIRKGKGAGGLTGLDFFALGALSKLIATTITYPYIVVKSRMQLKRSENESENYNSLSDGFKKIIANEGVPGLFKGIQSKLFQSVLQAAILFSSKEMLYRLTLLFVLGIRRRRMALKQ